MKHPVKQAIKKFYADKSLSETQLQSLQSLQEGLLEPLTQENITKTKPTATQWFGSIAASLLLLSIVFAYSYTPAVITAAYADINLDAKLNNGMQSSTSQWLSENLIKAVPEKFPVEMSKFCTLDNYKTTHLRIAGYEQGTLHLFFHRGKQPIHWLNRSGTADEMNWKLIEARDNLTVVVLYSKDMRESSVRQILDKMLPVLNT